jgi:hypothetical protein
MELLYPKGINVFPDSYRGNLQTSWEKIVLHSMEAKRYYPSSVSYAGHQYWPTASLAPHNISGDWTIYNHLPLNRTGAALKNLAGGVETNNDGVIQIEICSYAAEGPDVPDACLDVLADWLQWVHNQTGISLDFIDDFHEYPPEDGYRLGHEPWRMSFQEWDSFRGICAHANVPENVHGDPGKIRIPYLKKKLQGKKEEMEVPRLELIVCDDNKAGPIQGRWFKHDGTTRWWVPTQAQATKLVQLGMLNADVPRQVGPDFIWELIPGSPPDEFSDDFAADWNNHYHRPEPMK